VLKLVDGIIELYRKVATSLPPDVESALQRAYSREDEGSNSRNSLGAILDNIKMARKSLVPLCRDTGIPIFFVHVPAGLSQGEVRESIMEATRIATSRVPLKPNAVDIVTGQNSGDNTGTGFPVIYLEETTKDTLVIDLMLKGSGCENIGLTYQLPEESLSAERDLEGVRRCIIDTIYKAQGKACPPYTVGVGIGASKDQVAVLAKKQLLRKLTDKNSIEPVDTLEKRALADLNTLSIGTLGYGSKTTALGVKIGTNHRHPASYFVEVSISCWANRRGTLLW
jgi:fumarate hydratase class I